MDTLHVGKRFFAATGDVSPDQWCIHDGRIALSVPASESICFGGLNKEEAIALVEMFDRLTEPADSVINQMEELKFEIDSIQDTLKDVCDGLDKALATDPHAAISKQPENHSESADHTAKLNALRAAVKDVLEYVLEYAGTESGAIQRLREAYDAN